MVNDVDPDGTNPQAHWGLIEVTSENPATWTKNPTFDAVKRFFNLIKDPGPAFGVTNLQMTLSTPNSAHKDFLIQKRNGQYLLIMWRDASFWNTTTHTDINLADQNRTLGLATARPVALYNPRLQSAAVQTFASNTSFSLPIGSDVMVAVIG
jgi:hypothetical protein